VTTIVFVIIFNLLLTGMNCFLIVKVWQLRQTLGGVTQTLSNLDRDIYNIFHPAPPIIDRGQAGIHNLREVCQKKQRQIEQIQQILTLTALIYRIGTSKKGNRWSRLVKKNKKKKAISAYN
jgi:hypothetical protein